jgi:regulatory factor X
LALTQQQVYADPKQATPSAIIDDGTKFAPPPAFPIDPALGSVSPAPAEYKAFKPSDVEVPSSPPSVEDLPQLQNAPALEEEEEIVEDDVAMAVEDESTVGNISSRPKKRSSSSAEDNDAELRRLAKENADVELSELARRVRNEENSPSAEKTRQVYGLGWYVHHHHYGTCSLD